jgi:hypothetical protein
MSPLRRPRTNQRAGWRASGLIITSTATRRNSTPSTGVRE